MQHIASQIQPPAQAFKGNDGSLRPARALYDPVANQNYVSEDFARGLGASVSSYTGGPVNTAKGSFIPSGTIYIAPMKRKNCDMSYMITNQDIEETREILRLRALIEVEITVPKPGFEFPYQTGQLQPYHLIPPGPYGDIIEGDKTLRLESGKEDSLYYTYAELKRFTDGRYHWYHKFRIRSD